MHGGRIQADFEGLGLTLGRHPMALLRPQLPGVLRAGDLPNAPDGSVVRIAGNVICRQRPGTAKGYVFISLEDETGISNAIVAPPLSEPAASSSPRACIPDHRRQTPARRQRHPLQSRTHRPPHRRRPLHRLPTIFT